MATWLNVKKKDIELKELHEIFDNSPKNFYIKYFDGKNKNHYEIEIRHNEGIDVKKEFFKELERIRKEKDMENKIQITIIDNKGQEFKTDDIDKSIKNADTERLNNSIDLKKEYWTDIYQKLSEIKKKHIEAIQKGEEMYSEEKYDQQNRLIYSKNNKGDTFHREFSSEGKLKSHNFQFKNGDSQVITFDNNNEGELIAIKDVRKDQKGTRIEELSGDNYQNKTTQGFNRNNDLIYEDKTIIEDADIRYYKTESKRWDYNNEDKLELNHQAYIERIDNDRIIVGGSINEIAGKSLTDKNYLQLFDKNLQNTIETFLKVNPNVQPMPLTTDEKLAMDKLNKYTENQKQNLPIDENLQKLQDKVKLLGLGNTQEIRNKIAQIYHGEQGKSQITTTSDRVMAGNKVEFNLNFNKTEKGTYFNSYQAKLTTKQGEERTHTFNVQNNNVTGKEAINLLEGRAVKMNFQKLNKETGEITQNEAFVKLKLKEEKNDNGNYKFEGYNIDSYGINTEKIIEKSNIKGTPAELENIKKHLEKGNITSVTFQHEQKEIKGYAVLNPQWKMLNLYDDKMSRVNSNKQSLEINTEQNQKNNVLQQKNGRSI